jgi:hypothetical protein
MTTKGLPVVYDLYTLQLDLIAFLEKSRCGKNDLKEAKQKLKNFSTLLMEADKALLGGDDVYDELVAIMNETKTKVKQLRAKTKVKA